MKALFIIPVLGIAIYFGGCSYRHVDTIKANADATWQKAGFKVVGYEGYTIGSPQTPGGCVWYTVEKIGDSRVRFSGFISKWGSEFHVYNLRALDAIKNN